jgi:hypothetical protein
MKILHLNCSSGIAGDMILSAIINTGIIKPAAFETKIKSAIPKTRGWWKFKVTSVSRHHFPCTLTEVIGDKMFHSPTEMRNIIAHANLAQPQKQLALRIFDTLVSAESKVHKVKPDHVHFHELNSIDTLVDIFGTVIGMDYLTRIKYCRQILTPGLVLRRQRYIFLRHYAYRCIQTVNPELNLPRQPALQS